jgi:hypothetical protein
MKHMRQSSSISLKEADSSNINIISRNSGEYSAAGSANTSGGGRLSISRPGTASSPVQQQGSSSSSAQKEPMKGFRKVMGFGSRK